MCSMKIFDHCENNLELSFIMKCCELVFMLIVLTSDKRSRCSLLSKFEAIYVHVLQLQNKNTF